jgi:hypothetical protein
LAEKSKTGAVEEKQIISKKRVADHGEVLTGKREVEAMLDLVKDETARLESRFLEPACGDGNFLASILERKIEVANARHKKDQPDWERAVVTAISSIYGVDIIEDNATKCRSRLFGICVKEYVANFKEKVNQDWHKTIAYILEKNIIWGDALSLKTVTAEPRPIIFSQWSFVDKNMIKRHDYTFHGLLDHAGVADTPLFSDLGDDVFIPKPEKEYPKRHFLKLSDEQ